MKKIIYLFFGFLFFSNSLFAQQTYVPDNAFEAYLEANSMGNGIANDNYVTTANISSVTTLFLVRQNGIANLTGVEGFVSLETFIVSGGNNTFTTVNLSNSPNLGNVFINTPSLASINVNGLTNLTSLNLQDTGISSINVSTNSALQTLGLIGTSVASIDVSNNTALTQAYLSRTNITNLDLRNNSNLTSVYVDDTSIEHIDLRNGNNTNMVTFSANNTPNIDCISVDNLAYSVANWTANGGTSAFSAACFSTYVPDDNFESYLEANGMGNGIANDDHVLTANISSKTILSMFGQSISDLTGIEDFQALSELIVDNNNLTNVDLSNNTNLTRVSITVNPLTSLNVSNLSNLILLNVGTNTGGTNLSPIDLSTNTALESLFFYNSSVTAVDVSNNTALRTLSVGNTTNLTSVDLRNNPNLTSLTLSNSALKSVDLRNGNNTSITTFSGGNTPNLTCVNVDNTAYAVANWTVNGGTSAFGEHCNETYVPDNNFEAYLEANGMGDGIANNDYVTTANISSKTSLVLLNQGIANLTGVEGFQSLTLLFVGGDNNTFSSVDLTRNSNLKAVALSVGTLSSINVSNLTDLISLDLKSSNISSINVSTNTALESLVLSETIISSLDVSNNPTLKVLYLSNTNTITSIDLRNNPNLLELYINDSNMESVDLRNGNNTILTEFDARNTPNLTCVNVDSATYSLTNWTNITNSSAFSEHCNETYVPDNNFEVFLEANGMGNGIANDDYVSTTTIASQISLSIQNNSISDLTGIEGFANLKLLIVKQCNLTSLDVSANTQLTHLNFEGNQITSIDLNANTDLKHIVTSNNSLGALDVSMLTKLITLESINNSLSTLDINNTPLLTVLKIGDNQLTAIDVSSHTSLTQLDVSNNNLESLNVANGNNNNFSLFDARGNSNLSCINVDDIGYSTTNWGNKDAIASYDEYCYETYVPDNNFEAFLEANGMGDGIANNDYVTTANISSVTSLNLNSQSISDLTGIAAFTALETLDASFNNLTSLDVSTNTALTYLSIRGNNGITALDVSALTSLETLIAYNTSLTSINVSNNTALKILQLNSTNISSLDVSSNTALESLSIRFLSGLTSIDLSANVALQILDVMDSAIATLDLSNNTGLTELYARRGVFTSLNVKNGNNTNITTFQIQDNASLFCVLVDNVAYANTNFTSKEAATIYSETCGTTNVPDDNFEAYLEANGMGNGIANDNLVYTDVISSVTSLNIASQSISDLTGIEAFTALETLDARFNNLTTVDVTANTNLKVLFLRDNDLTAINASGLTALETIGIKDNPTLTTLDLSSLTALSNLGAANTGISSLDLSNNTALFRLDLENTSNITDLDLTNNSNLTDLLVSNTSLESIDLRNGNNTIITTLSATNTPSLTCVNVDNTAYAVANWTVNGGASAFAEHCNETYVPDNDFEAFLESNGLGNGIANDDYVSTTAIASETSLYIQDNNVSDLTGIEGFTNLEVLLVRRCNLTSLDISANTNLTHLNINDNQITSLDLSSNTELVQIITSNNPLGSLDVSNLTKLTSIASHHNNLTTLDISNNPLLTVLRVGDNQLTTIDVSSHTSLIQLDGSNNNLEFLNAANGNNSSFNFFDARGNSNLSCINVDDIAYSTSNWGDKDVTASYSVHCDETYVADNNFEAFLEANGMGNGVANDDYVLTAGVSSVTSLDVSNQSITDLTGIEDFTGLTSLNASGNTLTTIDVSNNTALETLIVRNTSITELDLRLHTSLTYFDANGAELTSLDIRNGNNTNFTTFDVHNNLNLQCISVDDVDYSNSNWSSYVAVFNRSCGETYVPDDNFEMYLETHDVTGRSVAMGSANSLGNGVMDNFIPTSKINVPFSLDVSSQNITDLTGIEDFIRLLDLNISNNNISSLDLSNLEMASLNVSNTSLTSLDVTSLTFFLITLDISNTSIASINLSSSPSLGNLNISNTSITNLDVTDNERLVQLNAQNSSLTSLDLRNGSNTRITTFNTTGSTNLTCVQVDDVAYSTTNWTDVDVHTSFSENGCGVVLSAKVFLHGAYDSASSMMRADLGSARIPTNTPHNDGVTASSGVFDVTGNNAIVDWVYVELRDKDDITNVLYSSSALLQRDGDIVGMDGTSPLTVAADSGDYYVSVSHRNHIPIATDMTFSLSSTTTVVDMTTMSNVRGGSTGTIEIHEGRRAMLRVYYSYYLFFLTQKYTIKK